MWFTLVVLVTATGPFVMPVLPHAESELNRLFYDSGVRVQVHSAPGMERLGRADAVVHVTVKGRCLPGMTDPKGTLASIEFVDGVPLPFVDVECDRIARFILPDRRTGKAVGRVLAHELLHLLLGARGHAGSANGDGLFDSWVRPETLTADGVVLPPQETDLLPEALAAWRARNGVTTD